MIDAAALVLDGHSRAAVEVVQSLGRSAVAVDLAATGPTLAEHSRYCRKKLIQPDTADRAAFAAWLTRQVTESRYQLIVPSTEASLQALGSLPDDAPLIQRCVLAPRRSLAVALDKQQTWDLANTLGIPVPRSRVIAGETDIRVAPQSYPLVLKPWTSLVEKDGEVVRLTPQIVRRPDAWHRTIRQLLRYGPVLEQEHIGGRGVGIECLYRNGRCLWHFQHERLHELPLTGGGSSYRRSVAADPELLEASTRLLDDLQWHGVAMVEFKGTPEQGFRLMEINPRLWGSVALPIDAGVDFPKGLWHVANEEDPGPQPEYRRGYYTRHLESDIQWYKENLKADHADRLLLTAPRLGAALETGRLLLGRESWDHFDWHDRSVTWRTVRHVVTAEARAVARRVRSYRTASQLRRAHRRLLSRGSTSSRPLIARILFVCYGNICRSPFAEYRMRASGTTVEIRSAGFHHAEGRRSPEWFREVASGYGIDLSDHRSARLSEELVGWAELIVLADEQNAEQLRQEYPAAVPKSTMLGLFLGAPRVSIADPYQMPQDEARVVCAEVLEACQRLGRWVDGGSLVR